MKTHDRYQAQRLLSILFVLAVISPIHAAEARADDDEALIVASARDDGPAKTSASKHRAHKHRKSRSLVLWTDPKTGELFTRSGPGCVRANISLESLGVITEGPAETRLEKKIEAKTESKVHRRIGIVQKESNLQNAAFAHQISAMKPAWQEYGERWFKKIKIGALLYADYAFYTHT